MTAPSNGPTGDSEDAPMESEVWSKIQVTPYRKEALRRALSNLEVTKRRDAPEIARKVVSRHLDSYVGDPALPPFVSGFFDSCCRSYLAALYIREGEQGMHWRQSLAKLEELAWSLQPKCDKDSCRRLYALLPALQQWIHAVLRARQINAADEDAFFSQLSRLHAAALHPDTELAEGSAPGFDAEPKNAQLSAALSSGEADGRRGDLEAADAGDAGQPQPSTDRLGKVDGALLGHLTVGGLVEFQSRRATKRVLRLEWVSGEQGVYLFRDEKRGDALCLTVHRCVQCLRDGTISVLG